MKIYNFAFTYRNLIILNLIWSHPFYSIGENKYNIALKKHIIIVSLKYIIYIGSIQYHILEKLFLLFSVYRGGIL